MIHIPWAFGVCSWSVQGTVTNTSKMTQSNILYPLGLTTSTTKSKIMQTGFIRPWIMYRMNNGDITLCSGYGYWNLFALNNNACANFQTFSDKIKQTLNAITNSGRFLLERAFITTFLMVRDIQIINNLVNNSRSIQRQITLCVPEWRPGRSGYDLEVIAISTSPGLSFRLVVFPGKW